MQAYGVAPLRSVLDKKQQPETNAIK